MFIPRSCPILNSLFRWSLTWVASLLLTWCGPSNVAWSQVAVTGNGLPTVDEIATRLAEVDTLNDLPEATKAQVKQLYQQAQQELEAAQQWARQRVVFEKMVETAELDAQAARDELERLQRLPPASLTEFTLAELQQRQSEVEADSQRAKAEVGRLAAELTRRQVRQRELPGELETIARTRAELQQQLVAETPAGEPLPLSRARHTQLQARIAALNAQRLALERELPAYSATSELLPVEQDVASNRLARAEVLQTRLTQRIAELRQDDASRQIDDAQLAYQNVPPELQSVAAENLRLAQRNRELLARLQSTTALQQATARVLADTKQEFERTRSKVDTVGLTDALGVYLRSKPAQLAALRTQYRPGPSRRAAIGELQFELLQMEDARSSLSQLDVVVEKTLDELGIVRSEAPRNALRPDVEQLLEQRRATLTRLLHSHRSLFESMVALDIAEHELVQVIDRYSEYIEGWTLWVRSTTPLSVQDLSRSADVLRWLTLSANLSARVQVLRSVVWQRPFISIAFALAFLILLIRKRELRNKLAKLGAIAAPRRCREFKPTAEAALLTGVMAAVWPTLLYFVGWEFVYDPGGTQNTQAAGWGLIAAANFSLLTEFTRQLCRTGGLGDCHFHWPEPTRQLLQWHLRWLTLITPLAFLTIFFQHHEDLSFGNSLGRLSFIGWMLAVSLFAQRILRPQGAPFAHLAQTQPNSWTYRLRHVSYAIGVGTPLLLVGLAAAGYYYSALHLAQRLFSTSWVLMGLSVAGWLLLRWILVNRRRLAYKERLAARQLKATASDPIPGNLEIEPEADIALEEVGEQTRQLMRTGVLLALVGGLWWVWRDVFPAIEFLDGFTVWRVGVLDRIEAVTLKHLLFCGITLLTTIVAVKNIPGLLELVFLRRLPLDAGARYAIAMISRYLLGILGFVIALGFIRVQWSQYGWIVAAATVGLGFGLQEIFANFVSGLIVLLERPVRVGDVVTVDGVTGIVSRIHMRATVVTNWDRQELIVPNKEFVTTKLLNWTLTNSVSRIVLPVGVAYGSDTERARTILLNIASRHPHVLSDPPPSATFEQFGDSTLNFTLRCFVGALDVRLPTIHDLHTAIHQQFHEAGIEIAFPQRDLHVRSLPPTWPKSIPGDDELPSQ